MTEEIRDNYECSSGNLRTWEIPYARLIDTTPTVSNPAAVNGLDYGNGEALTGVIISLGVSDAGTSFAVLDCAPANVYYFEVRNVLTYDQAVEATWGAINIGDPVYYDDSATMPAGVYLSTSPLDNLGNANVKYGHVVGCNISDMEDYPKGSVTASTQECGVMLIGAGTN
jgi:hypothetical protein